MKVIKKIISVAIAFLPGNKIRIFFYRNFLGYFITYDSKIGPFNLLFITQECRINGGIIGMFNKFDCKRLIVGQKSRINKFNRVSFADHVIMGNNSVIRNNNSVSGTIIDTPYKEYEGLTIGDNCTITSGHIFDCSDSIKIGTKVIIGGKGSQFWTHGFTNDKVKIQGPIIFEDDIYVGTRCLFMPAIKICTNNVIAGGTTVSKSILESGIYASSKLIRIADVKKLYDSVGVVTYKNSRYLRKTV